MEEHVCHELRDLNVASGNTLVTWLHTSPREKDRYQAVCSILGQGPTGNYYEYPERGQNLLERRSFLWRGGGARRAPSFSKSSFGLHWCPFV